MTRRDFTAFAAMIRGERERIERIRDDLGETDLWGDYTLMVGTLERMADQIADHCRQVNPHFDRERFMTACGF